MAFSKSQAFEYLSRSHKQNRLAHAYLLHGPRGSGKRALAESMCDLVGGGDGGGGFRRLDVRVIEPESKSRRIRIDQIRALEHALQMRASGPGRKVGVILDADRFQIEAANAFLKTLEEPPANSMLVLVTRQPEVLPETILSRCIQVPLASAGREEPGPAEQAVLELLRRHFEAGRPGLTETLGLLHGFLSILRDAREEIAGGTAGDLKAEQQTYKETTEGKWLDGREEYYKGLSESLYLAERTRLVEVLVQWWADVFRQQQGVAELDYPLSASFTAALAGRLDRDDVLARVEALEELRERLERNVQETLAFEVAFLKAFAAAD